MKSYVYTSIIDGRTIKYEQMKIKHQRILIESADNILENGYSPTTFIDQFKEIIFDLIDIPKDQVYYSDFENLMFLIRAKSFGDFIEYTKKINNQKYDLRFDISKDLSIIGEIGKSSDKIPLNNGSILIIEPIRANEYFEISKLNVSKSIKKLNLLIVSARAIEQDDEIIRFQNFKEKEEYIIDLDIEDLENIKKSFNSFPKISATKTELIDGIEYNIDFSDMESNFFVTS